MKRQATAVLLMEAHRIGYNYIRPHETQLHSSQTEKARQGRTGRVLDEAPERLFRTGKIDAKRLIEPGETACSDAYRVDIDRN